MKKHKRTRKLILPRLQMRVIGAFLGISTLGFLLQALLLSSRLSSLAASLATGGSAVEREIPTLLIETLLLSFLVLLPVTLAVGLVATFRIAGPVFRFQEYLRQIVRGEEVGRCSIRKTDELHELCDLLNEAVETLREGERADAARSAETQPDATEPTDRAA